MLRDLAHTVVHLYCAIVAVAAIRDEKAIHFMAACVYGRGHELLGHGRASVRGPSR